MSTDEVLFSDKPITQLSQDRLGRDAFVKRLGQTIDASARTEPQVKRSDLQTLLQTRALALAVTAWHATLRPPEQEAVPRVAGHGALC